MADGYDLNKNQVSLAVMLWLSGVVVDWVFISEGVDVRTETYSLITAALNFFNSRVNSWNLWVDPT